MTIKKEVKYADLISEFKKGDYREMSDIFSEKYWGQEKSFIGKMIIYCLIKKSLKREERLWSDVLSSMAYVFVNRTKFLSTARQDGIEGHMDKEEVFKMMEKMVDELDTCGLETMEYIYPLYCLDFEEHIYEMLCQKIKEHLNRSSTNGIHMSESCLKNQQHQYLDENGNPTLIEPETSQSNMLNDIRNFQFD